MIDLEYFCWREPCKDTTGQDRLLIPHADPDQYEDPIDSIFASAQDAIDFRCEYIEELSEIATDSVLGQTGRDEVAEVKSWVLVHYTGQIVSPVTGIVDPFADELLRIQEELDQIAEYSSKDHAAYAAGQQLHARLRRLFQAADTDEKKNQVHALTDRLLRKVFGLSTPEENQ